MVIDQSKVLDNRERLKPRMWFSCGVWVCVGRRTGAIGFTSRDAYRSWFRACADR